MTNERARRTPPMAESAKRRTQPGKKSQQSKRTKGAATAQGPGGGSDKPTGRKRRRAARQEEATGVVGLPAVYRPDEVLSPQALLKAFSDRARELLAEFPEDARPGDRETADTLRRAVLEAFRTREESTSRMVELDLVAGGPNTSRQSIQRAIRGSLIDQGIRCVEVPDEPEHFVVVEGEGAGFEVLRPAYVDQMTGRLILAGHLRRVRIPETDRAEGAHAGDGSDETTVMPAHAGTTAENAGTEAEAAVQVIGEDDE